MDKHNFAFNCPPPTPLVLTKAKTAYSYWHKNLINLNRLERYTVGAKIDGLFTDLLETIFRACFAYDKFEKLSLVSQSIDRTDLIKFFCQIAWEEKVLNHKQYGELLILIDEVGRMLGGWKKSLAEKTPANK